MDVYFKIIRLALAGNAPSWLPGNNKVHDKKKNVKALHYRNVFQYNVLRFAS